MRNINKSTCLTSTMKFKNPKLNCYYRFDLFQFQNLHVYECRFTHNIVYMTIFVPSTSFKNYSCVYTFPCSTRNVLILMFACIHTHINKTKKSKIKLPLRMSVVLYSSFVCISAYANVYFKRILRECLRAGLPSDFPSTAPPTVLVPAVLGTLASCVDSKPKKNKIRPAPAKVDFRWGHVSGGSMTKTFCINSLTAEICLFKPQIQKLVQFKDSKRALYAIYT